MNDVKLSKTADREIKVKVKINPCISIDTYRCKLYYSSHQLAVEVGRHRDIERSEKNVHFAILMKLRTNFISF